MIHFDWDATQTEALCGAHLTTPADELSTRRKDVDCPVCSNTLTVLSKPAWMTEPYDELPE